MSNLSEKVIANLLDQVDANKFNKSGLDGAVHLKYWVSENCSLVLNWADFT